MMTMMTALACVCSAISGTVQTECSRSEASWTELSMTELKLHPEVGLHVQPILPPARLDYNFSNNHGPITPPGELNEGYLMPNDYDDYYSVVIDNESCAADTGITTDTEQFSTSADDNLLFTECLRY